jgi:hypothetical protein
MIFENAFGPPITWIENARISFDVRVPAHLVAP